ncbi:MAG: CRISPR-associated helicase Cas3' [Longimicrobiaceae bacterium]
MDMMFWAKRSLDGSGRIHPLFAHSADVCAVLERMIAPGAILASRLAATQGTADLHPRHRASLLYLSALHDIGKTNHGFQGQGTPPHRFARRGHVKVLLQSLGYDPLFDALVDLLLRLQLSEEEAMEMFRTTIAHHGRPWDVPESNQWHALWKLYPDVPRDPVAEIRRLGALALRWSGLADAPAGPPLRVTPALTHLFAGALTLADWIGSTERAFPFAPDADPETYWHTARRRAEAACAAIGLAPRTVELVEEGDGLLRRIFPRVFPSSADRIPTRLQLRLAEMTLPAPGTRLLVESETGSGKTEAALVLYARLRAAGVVGGLVFALPTRATSKAMYDRVLAALPGIYGDRQPSVALAAGGTQPAAKAESDGSMLADPPLVYDEDEEDGAGSAARAAELARWSSQSAKRFMAAEIVVGTLDQLLLGALPVRHAHLRLAGLTRHLLVVDELHSYDRFMTGVLRRLLELHTGHGGIALFMSATLADATRREFGGAAEPEASRVEAETRPYPALSVCLPGGVWREEELFSPSLPKTVSWATCTLADGLKRAVEGAAAGARVLVVRNTVKGARAAVDTLHAAGAAALLWSPREGAAPAYHSRYAPPDRAALDDSVLGLFGRGCPGEGTILVATQVAEQSLDVDFDLLVTDLCPVDVLLQRIGRLWRHPERTRPEGITEARVWVVVPEEGIEAILASGLKMGRDGWGTVYPDLVDLELTLHTIREPGTIEIPRDNRRLVESVYHPERRQHLELLPEWTQYVLDRDGKEFATDTHALNTALDFSGKTYVSSAIKFSDAAEAKIRTRLGDDRVRLPLGREIPCRYAQGKTVDFVELPEDVCASAGIDFTAPEFTAWETLPNGMRCRLGAYTLSYTDAGWEWERRSGKEGDGSSNKTGSTP